MTLTFDPVHVQASLPLTRSTLIAPAIHAVAIGNMLVKLSRGAAIGKQRQRAAAAERRVVDCCSALRDVHDHRIVFRWPAAPALVTRPAPGAGQRIDRDLTRLAREDQAFFAAAGPGRYKGSRPGKPARRCGCIAPWPLEPARRQARRGPRQDDATFPSPPCKPAEPSISDQGECSVVPRGSVAVVVGLVRALCRHADIVRLVGPELGELGPHLRQM